MSTFWYTLVAALLLIVSVLLVRSLGRRFSLAALSALVVAVGLVYDNTVIAAGAAIGQGALLEGLNWVRYAIHALATPLLVMFAWDVAARAGSATSTVEAETRALTPTAAVAQTMRPGQGSPRSSWARRPSWRAFFVVVTVALIVYGVIVDLLPLRLEAETVDGVLSYAPAGGSAFPLPAAVTMGVVLAVGIWLWRVPGWPWLAVLTAAASVLFGVAPALGVPVVGQAAEVVLLAGILVTERWLVGRESGSNGQIDGQFTPLS